MAPTLGKRKRSGTEKTEKKLEVDRESSVESEVVNEEDAQAIFRRHFEAQFKPLPVVAKVAKPQVEHDEDDDDEGGESDWDGISDEDDDAVEVIEHTKAELRQMLPKSELKALLSSKPPSLEADIANTKTKKGKIPIEDDNSDSAHLKKDLELQRLLSESHLLDSSTFTSTGTNRHKATDLRLQKLGGKNSIFKQEKMPKSHRIGMTTKGVERESKRRREAKENGIILETAKEKKRTIERTGKRGMNVSLPGVGKFSGGMLSLSKKDIMSIEGPRKSTRGGGRGRGGGGRGRGGKTR